MHENLKKKWKSKALFPFIQFKRYTIYWITDWPVKGLCSSFQWSWSQIQICTTPTPILCGKFGINGNGCDDGGDAYNHPTQNIGGVGNNLQTSISQLLSTLNHPLSHNTLWLLSPFFCSFFFESHLHPYHHFPSCLSTLYFLYKGSFTLETGQLIVDAILEPQTTRTQL